MRDRRILYLLGGILALGTFLCLVRVSPLYTWSDRDQPFENRLTVDYRMVPYHGG